MVTHHQIRAARALVGMSQTELARLAGISVTGLGGIERGVTDAKGSTLRAIQAALEEAGVVFIDAVGVRLKDG